MMRGGWALRLLMAALALGVVLMHHMAGAHEILVLDRGHLVGVGTLDEVLHTCPEMRRLWGADLVEEAEQQEWSRR